MLENKIEELTRAVERLSEILLGMPNPNEVESDEKNATHQQKQETVEPATTQEQSVSHDDNAESPSGASRQDLQDYVLKHVRQNPKLKTQIKAILEKYNASSITVLADEHINAVFDEVKAL